MNKYDFELDTVFDAELTSPEGRTHDIRITIGGVLSCTLSYNYIIDDDPYAFAEMLEDTAQRIRDDMNVIFRKDSVKKLKEGENV